MICVWPDLILLVKPSRQLKNNLLATISLRHTDVTKERLELNDEILFKTDRNSHLVKSFYHTKMGSFDGLENAKEQCQSFLRSLEHAAASVNRPDPDCPFSFEEARALLRTVHESLRASAWNSSKYSTKEALDAYFDLLESIEVNEFPQSEADTAGVRYCPRFIVVEGLDGSGKSTLASVLAGHDDYEVTGGSVSLDGKDLLDMETSERACEGVFMAFQYPVEIPGVSNTEFLKASINSVRKHRGQPVLNAVEFLKLVRETMKEVGMPEDLLKRSVNEGFSGGEKKKHEVFQMSLLEPKLAILDETDSGLDVYALRIVANGVNAMRSPDRSFLVITHYQRLLEYIVPDVVHVLIDGRIVKSGGKELAVELDNKGYDWVREEVGIATA